MKKIIKIFSLIFLALALVLVPFAVNKKTEDFAGATFDENYSAEYMFKENMMLLEYADDVLIGVDKDGYVYQAQDGNVSSLTNINVKLPLHLSAFTTNNGAFGYGLNELLLYNNGVLLFAGHENGTTKIFYSLDKGKNWEAVNIGSKLGAGYPISILYGNGKYALMTAVVNASEVYQYAKIYTSSNTSEWELASDNICLDYNFSYSGGYFFRAEYFSKGKDPRVYYSADCKTWNYFISPVKQISSGTTYSNPDLAIARINNSFYLAGFGDLYSSTTPSGTWRKVASVEELASAYKIVPYNNGALFMTDNSVIYADLGENDVTNINYLASTGFGRYYATYANTVAENDEKLVVGFSGYYQQTYLGANESVEGKNAKFVTYLKQLKHLVNFVDYNGNVISSIEVADGSLVSAPTNPTRVGYTFKGWDYDLTQPITENITITAQYEKNKCLVRFVDGSEIIKEFYKEYGSTLTKEEIPVPTKDGYVFKGWDKVTTGAITTDITFVAEFSKNVTLTIKYPEVTGTFGLLNQFKKTNVETKTFTYTIGNAVVNEEYLTWYNANILPWVNDLSEDGKYDYDKKYIGFSLELPEYINSDLEITIDYVDLYNVRLEHYSQLRFQVSGDYYYCFVGYLKTEKLVEYGYIFKANDFKRSDVDYEIYNANQNEFYNNLNHFEWLGWDYDTKQPITEDLIIKGQYKMPTINVRMFDAEDYMFNEENQELGFMTIEDYYLTLTSKSDWDKFREGLRLFFLGRWGELGGNIADQIDLEDYIDSTKKYHNEATQILTAYAKIDTDNPDIYGGVFKNGSVNVTSEALSYYSGTANENNMTYWVNPIVFCTNLYSLTCTVTYGTALDSAIKSVSNVVGFITDIFSVVLDWILEYWWVVLLIVLFIIFRKELVMFIKLIFTGIINFFKWIGNKIKGATKKRNQAKKQVKKVNKQLKEKE